VRREKVVDTLPRVDARVVSLEARRRRCGHALTAGGAAPLTRHGCHAAQEFARNYEQPRVPCIITHAMDGWPAATPGGARQWTWPALRERFKDHKFKVGSDDDGYAVRLKMQYFCAYVADEGPSGCAVDDSPLYVFDGTYGDRDGSKELLRDYSVPPYFREDLFGLAGDKRRPPYRWVVFGPARSGSSLHIDPLATAAWNALLAGRKRWVLLPPGVPRAACKPRGLGLDSEAISWFTHVLPRCRAPDWPHARPIEAVQSAGEIMFVPHGWWHAVLNLEHTIAVTQNYASTANFGPCWRHTRKARPRLAAKWLAQLRVVRPDLAVTADALDALNEAVSESSPSSSSSSSSSSDEDSSDDDAAPADAPTAAEDAPPVAKRAHTDAQQAPDSTERAASWRRRKSDTRDKE
jgi:histone arginine demethylase JMJD6